MVWPADNGELLVTGLMEDTSAAGCGLEENDIITAVDGASIRHLPAADASHLLSGRIHSTVEVEVQRGEGANASIVRVTLARDVPIDVAESIDADVGVAVWPDPDGALVITDVKAGTSAAKVGLQKGDTITMVDEVDVTQMPAARVAKMLKGTAGSDISLTVSRAVAGVASTIMVTVSRDVYIETLKGVVKCAEGRNMMYTNEQKASEDELFGLFAGMTLSNLPEAGALCGLLQDHMRSHVLKPEAGLTAFTQMLHWLAMQEMSHVFADEQWNKALAASPALAAVLALRFADGEQVVSKEAAFEFAAKIIDAIVPSLSPEFFKILDHNQVGQLNQAEWSHLGNILHVYSGRRLIQRSPSAPAPPTGMQSVLLDLVFCLLDKEGSGFLMAEGVTDIVVKLVPVLAHGLEAALRVSGDTLNELLETELVGDIFACLDCDDDGVLTADELFLGFPSGMLLLIQRLPNVMRRYTTPSARGQVAGADVEDVSLGQRLKTKALSAVCTCASVCVCV